MFLKKISTPKITLRPLLRTDISAWVLWHSDPEVLAFLPEPHEKETLESGEKFFIECEASNDELHAGIVDTRTKTFIGTISLTDINRHHGVGELGIILGDKNYWNQGYATEAIGLFLNGAKHLLGLRRVLAECETENIGMKRVLEKSGFGLETLSKESRIKNGNSIDTYRYIKNL